MGGGQWFDFYGFIFICVSCALGFGILRDDKDSSLF